jgi:hypothetical protein
MYQVVSTALRKRVGILAGNGKPGRSAPDRQPASTAMVSKAHLSMVRGRRKDDIAFIVIAGLLVVLFFVQLSWLILGKSPL